MIIVPGKFVFLANPRTASSSVTQLLLDLYPDCLHTSHRHHCTIDELKVFPPRHLGCRNFEITTETKFSVVRNPYDVVASWFVLSGIGDFEIFLSQYQHTWFHQNKTLFPFAGISDVVMKYETLEADLSCFLQQEIKLPWLNATNKKKPWSYYYNNDTLNIVCSRYASDFKDYGYDLDTNA